LITKDEADAIRGDIAFVAKELGFPIRELRIRDYERHGSYSKRSTRKVDPSWSSLREDVARANGEVQEPSEIKQREGTRLRNRSARKSERDQGRRGYLADRLEQAIVSAIESNPVRFPKRNPPRASPVAGPYAVTAIFSDLHFGVEVDPREVLGCAYTWEIAARRFAYFCEQIAAFKPHHRKGTVLNAAFIGDIFEGVIHLAEALLDPLAVQWKGALDIIIAGLVYLLDHFERIEVHCTTGNHGRQTYKDKGRATNQKWDSYEYLLYVALQAAFRHEPRINFNIPLAPVWKYDTPGGTIAYAHGDMAPGVGSVNNSIDSGKVKNRIAHLMQSPEFRDISAMLFGHHHFCSMFPAGPVTVLVNGALIAGGGYGQNVCNDWVPRAEQWVFESAPGFAVGDARRIDVMKADGLTHLDAIVPPPVF
jgi:hypothetical protein